MAATPRAAAIAALCASALGIAPQGAAAEDCAVEAGALARSESELPRLDLTPPIHHQLVCITLETLVDFARRIDRHLGHCPSSDYAERAATWVQAHRTYAAKFRQYRCRRSL
jgi:hypothetical protein